MKKEAIKLLQQQLNKLEARDFDLESWKKYTIVLLSRIFSENSQKIKLIENLEYEFNSWSLRDASGNESYEDGTKKLAAEIIQASIDEINAFGIDAEKSSNEDAEQVLQLIFDELKGSQVKAIKQIIALDESDDEKKRQVFEIVESMGEKTAFELISQIILNIIKKNSK